LIVIYNAYPTDESKRLRDLVEKSEQGILTKKEHQEYMHLAEKAEANSLTRLENLVEFAFLRKVTVPNLMEQLGLIKSKSKDA
jgi:hypothetical protein